MNSSAGDDTELVLTGERKKSSPPMVGMLTKEDLKIISSGNEVSLSKLQQAFNVPCHKQAVERCEKEVTAAWLQCAEGMLATASFEHG